LNRPPKTRRSTLASSLKRSGSTRTKTTKSSTSAYIEFEVGEHPTIPYKCECFLRFSSKISGPGAILAEPYIRNIHRIAKKYFGDRVKLWQALFDQYGVYKCDEVREMRKPFMDEVNAVLLAR